MKSVVRMFLFSITAGALTMYFVSCVTPSKVPVYDLDTARTDFVEREYRGLIAIPRNSVGMLYSCEPHDYYDSDQVWPPIAYPILYVRDVHSLIQPSTCFTPMTWSTSSAYERHVATLGDKISRRFQRILKSFDADSTGYVLYVKDRCYCNSSMTNNESGQLAGRMFQGHIYVVRAVALKYIVFHNSSVSPHRNVSCVRGRNSYYALPMSVGAVTEFQYLDIKLDLPDTVDVAE